MSAGVPFLGSRISLISKAGIRYEGILYTVDPNESTVALSKVRSFGTEDRPTERPVPPRDEVYDFIIFRGSDIKDLHVCEPPSEPEYLDPAIVKIEQSVKSTSDQSPKHSGKDVPAGGAGLASLNPLGSSALVGGLPVSSGLNFANIVASPPQHGFQLPQQQQAQQHLPRSFEQSPVQQQYNQHYQQSQRQEHHQQQRQTVQNNDRRKDEHLGFSRSQQHQLEDNIGAHNQDTCEADEEEFRYPARHRRENRPRRGYERQDHPASYRGDGGYDYRRGYQGQGQNQRDRRGDGGGYRGYGGGGGGGGGGGDGQYRRGRGRPHSGVNQGPAVGSARTQYTEDYDFETANAEIANELEKMTLDNRVQSNGDVILHESKDSEDEDTTCYDKSKSFFDTISSEALDRANGLPRGPHRRDDRRTNVETFGVSGQSHRRDGGRGRGYHQGSGRGGRGGRRGGNPSGWR